jgi:hypothetical protein
VIGKHAQAECRERLMRPPPRELAQCSAGTQIIALQCVSGSEIGQGRWQRVDVDRFPEPADRIAGSLGAVRSPDSLANKDTVFAGRRRKSVAVSTTYTFLCLNLYDCSLVYSQFDEVKVGASEIHQPIAAALVRLPCARRSSQ